MTMFRGQGLAANIAYHDFDDNTLGPYLDFWDQNPPFLDIDVVDDPTPRATGKVARFYYHTTGAPAQRSDNNDIGHVLATPLTYNDHLWFTGEVYLPYPGTANAESQNRKLIDFLGGGAFGLHTRAIVHRSGLRLKLAIVDGFGPGPTDGDKLREAFDADTGIDVLSDTWYKIECHLIMNSAGNFDGVFEIYINGALTPTYRRDTGIQWIHNNYALFQPSFMTWVTFGTQLTIYADDPDFTEYRYWDKVGVSSQRIAA